MIGKAGVLTMVVLLTLWTQGTQAGVRASIDRDSMGVSESFELRLRVDGQAVAAEPELDALSRDFEVLSSSRNHRISLGQGVNESFTEWVLVLMPKREGRLEIPAIEVGGERSAPIALTVRPDADPGTSPDRDLVLEVELERDTVHVQQQLVLTVRLMHAVNLAQGATLEEPQIAGAVVRKLGEDSFEKLVGGRRYGVFERRYALFPQSSGELRVPALRFSGSVGGDSWFDRFGAGSRAVRLRSAERVVQVLPPEQGANPWLPARMLTLVETWDRDPERLRVGESATRTLTLSAEALTGAQLPPLPDPAIDGLRFYPDQPELSDAANADGVSGTRVQRVAVVAREAGTFALPELRLRWWDTVNERFDEAVIPARRIRVLPPPGGAPAAAPRPLHDTARAPRGEAADDNLAAPVHTLIAAERPWPWIAATVLLGLLALLSSTQWWRLARASRTTRPVAPPPSRESQAFRELLAACAGTDAGLATRRLLDWARLAWPDNPPASLATLRDHTRDPGLAAAIETLMASRYAAKGSAWRGESLREAVEALRRRRAGRAGDPDGGLSPLYPRGREISA